MVKSVVVSISLLSNAWFVQQCEDALQTYGAGVFDLLNVNSCRAAYKLHKDLAKTYSELSPEIREHLDSIEWVAVAEKFGLRRLPSCTP